MSVFSAPSASVEVTAYGFVTGLVGTIGVRVMDGQGNTSTDRTTSGIVESPAGSGVYTATLTAPSTAGQYVVVWDDTVTFTPEDLVVTYTAAVVASPSGVDLCTVAQVRAYMQTPSGDTNDDALAQTLITRASRAIRQYTSREFTLESGSNPRTRTFDVGGYWRMATREGVPVGDMASAPGTVRVLDSDGGTVSTLTVSTDVVALPTHRESWEPVTALRFRPDAQTLAEDYQLEVVGSFGWPAVPEDVAHACVVTVATWLRRGVQAFGTSYQPEDAAIAGPESLPAAVRAMLAQYRRIPVA